MEDQSLSTYVRALKVLGLYNDEDTNKVYKKLKDIEQAYRQLARIHHPDRGGDKRNFILITAAKDFLMNGGANDANTSPFCRSADDGGYSDHLNGDDCSSRVILRGRACVRDLATLYDDVTDGILVIAATDEGLKVADGVKSESKSHPEVNFESESVLCCALSPDGCFVFAGTSKGEIRRYPLQLATSIHVEDEKPMENLGILLDEVLDFEAKNIVAVAVSHDSSVVQNSDIHHIVVVLCDSPRAVIMFRFRNTLVETLWKMTDNNGLSNFISTLDTLILSQSATSNLSMNKDQLSTFNIWVGGSNNTNEGVLVKWEVCSESCSQDDDDDDCWSDSYHSDSETVCDMETYMPEVTQNLGYGAVYSMDESRELGIIAATVGSDVIILESTNEKASEKGSQDSSSLQIKKKLTTNNILYCVKILSRCQKVAACGAGESIVIWSLVRGTVENTIHLNSIKHCNLSTNCIMTLDWIDNENDTSIVSGGYDGNVTQWFIDTCTHKSRIRVQEKQVNIEGE